MSPTRTSHMTIGAHVAAQIVSPGGARATTVVHWFDADEATFIRRGGARQGTIAELEGSRSPGAVHRAGGLFRRGRGLRAALPVRARAGPVIVGGSGR